MGGANVIEYLVGLIRVKAIAVFLGPEGVGLASIVTVAISFITTATSFGISRAGVRGIATFNGADEPESLAKTIRLVRIGCWVTGCLGYLVTIFIASQFSDLIFKSNFSRATVLILGGVVLLTSIGAGEKAILQGMRRIQDIAKINIICAILNSAIAVFTYYYFGLEGIVPVLFFSAFVSLIISSYYAKKITINNIKISSSEVFVGIKNLSSLGVVLVVGSLMSAGLDIIVRIIIVNNNGLFSAGIYHSAWALSGLFAGFVFTAMGADFYPRLTSIIDNKEEACRLVNEQTEIGILLVMPGVLGVMVFSKFIVTILYSESFIEAAELLPWFLIGVFGRVVSWPMGVIQLAKGEKKWLLASETITILIQLVLVLILIPMFGLIGGAFAFALTYILFTIGMVFLSHYLIGFKWSSEVRNTLYFYLILTVLNVYIINNMSFLNSLLLGALLTIVSFIFSIKKIMQRISKN